MKQQEIADLSAELIIKYYENDYMPFLESFDDDSLWYGPAEGQFLRGREAMIRAWQAEEHSLRFTMGNLKVVHISGNNATCSVMLTYTVVTHYPDGHDDHVNLPCAAVGQQTLELRPLRLGSCDRFVHIHTAIQPFRLFLYVRAVVTDLRRQRVQHGVLAR